MLSLMSLVLEFTEHAMLTDEEETSRCLNELAALGVGIALAHHLGPSVTAEGVETEFQEKFLVENGCDELQGTRFSRPIPADELLPIIMGGNITPPK